MNWLVRYDRDASRYHKGVYARKRADLLATIDATLSPLFLGQLKNLHKSCLVTFRQTLQTGLKGEDYNYGDVVSTARAHCQTTFSTVAQEALIEDTDWSWEDELALLEEEIGHVADQCRKDETKKMVNQIERTVKKMLLEPVELSLNQPKKTMWDDILRTFGEVLSKAETAYLTKAKSTIIYIL